MIKMRTPVYSLLITYPYTQTGINNRVEAIKRLGATMKKAVEDGLITSFDFELNESLTSAINNDLTEEEINNPPV